MGRDAAWSVRLTAPKYEQGRRRPNGLPLSRRERWEACQNATDLVREAVGYSDVFGDNADFTQ
jgi:hypothetical protein